MYKLGCKYKQENPSASLKEWCSIESPYASQAPWFPHISINIALKVGEAYITFQNKALSLNINEN